MKFIDEYRDKTLVDIVARKIREITKGKWRIMEVCGSQTHTIMKYNLEELLPEGIELIHGPGCPVCVTPAEVIDKAIMLAQQEGIIIATYGDMLRVPGSNADLLSVKNGDNIQVIYSPLDTVRIAEENPDRTVVFLAVGFETTAPGNANAVLSAERKRLRNYLVLSSQVLIPPAIRYILGSGKSLIQGLLAPGHVCTITGSAAYKQISEFYKVPVVITGFEPFDILQGIYFLINHLEKDTYAVENEYSRLVKAEGNQRAIDDMFEVFEVCDFNWRGIGLIENSGLMLRDRFSSMNADLFYSFSNIQSEQTNGDCIAGDILQGLAKPHNCNLFRKECTPLNPVGAPMVSAEGVCAAYYKGSYAR